MVLTTSSEAVFACHAAACAPPPAGHGGSKPAGTAAVMIPELARSYAGRVSGAKAGKYYHDREHGPVTVTAVKDRPGKPYDEVEITKADGSKVKVFPGKAGLAGRSRPAYRPKDTGSGDDGYDALKDKYLTGEGPKPYPGFGKRSRGY